MKTAILILLSQFAAGLALANVELERLKLREHRQYVNELSRYAHEEMLNELKSERQKPRPWQKSTCFQSYNLSVAGIEQENGQIIVFITNPFGNISRGFFLNPKEKKDQTILNVAQYALANKSPVKLEVEKSWWGDSNVCEWTFDHAESIQNLSICEVNCEKTILEKRLSRTDFMNW